MNCPAFLLTSLIFSRRPKVGMCSGDYESCMLGAVSPLVRHQELCTIETTVDWVPPLELRLSCKLDLFEFDPCVMKPTCGRCK
eukprot:1688092-Amphidinium_carterae.1